MSAYLCSDCEFTALAKYAFLNTEPVAATLQSMFELLRNENIKSLKARYRDDDHRYGPGKLCSMCAAATFSLFEIYHAVHHYDYQSCDHNGWGTSAAKGMCSRILLDIEGRLEMNEETICKTKEYNKVSWGLTPRHNDAATRADITSRITLAQHDQDVALRDLLDATSAYVSATVVHQQALRDQAERLEHEPGWLLNNIANEEHIDDLRRFMQALGELGVTVEHRGILLELAHRLGVKL